MSGAHQQAKGFSDWVKGFTGEEDKEIKMAKAEYNKLRRKLFQTGILPSERMDRQLLG